MRLTFVLVIICNVAFSQSRWAEIPAEFEYGSHDDASTSKILTCSTYEMEVIDGQPTVNFKLSNYKKYDTFGNVIELAYGEGDTVYFDLDDFGNWVTKFSNGGLDIVRRNLIYHDNKVISRCELFGKTTLVTEIKYDSAYRPINKTEDIHYYSWNWDSNGNLQTWEKYSDSSLVERREFFYQSNILNATRIEYYINGELHDKDSAKFFYKSGNLSQEVVYIHMLTKQVVNTNVYFYDSDNLLVGANIEKTGFQYERDANGNLKEMRIYTNGVLQRCFRYEYQYYTD